MRPFKSTKRQSMAKQLVGYLRNSVGLMILKMFVTLGLLLFLVIRHASASDFCAPFKVGFFVGPQASEEFHVQLDIVQVVEAQQQSDIIAAVVLELSQELQNLDRNLQECQNMLDNVEEIIGIRLEEYQETLQLVIKSSDAIRRSDRRLHEHEIHIKHCQKRILGEKKDADTLICIQLQEPGNPEYYELFVQVLENIQRDKNFLFRLQALKEKYLQEREKCKSEFELHHTTLSTIVDKHHSQRLRIIEQVSRWCDYLSSQKQHKLDQLELLQIQNINH